MAQKFDHVSFGAHAAQIAAALYQPTHLVHVGFGRGIGETAIWQSWKVPEALVVDMAGPASPVPSRTDCGGDWKAITACVAGSLGERCVILSSSAHLDSLLNEDACRAVWPHARNLRTETVTTTTVDSLLQSAGLQAAPNWLIVDCFPAGEILNGAPDCLRTVQVLWVAVALELPAGWPSEAGLDAIDALATNAGLKRIWSGPGLNPALGHAVYVRDPGFIGQQLALTAQHLSDLRTQLEENALVRLQDADARAQLESLLADTLQEATFQRLENAILQERTANMEELQREVSSLKNEIHALCEELQKKSDEAETLAKSCEVLKETIKQSEHNEATRRAAALEDFRLARIHAQKEHERERLHEETRAALEEQQKRLACLHEALERVAGQMHSFKLLTGS